MNCAYKSVVKCLFCLSYCDGICRHRRGEEEEEDNVG